MEVLVSSGQAKPIGSWKQPTYVRADRAPVVRSPATRDAALRKLGAMLPGVVRIS